jgi:hypothetical protein
MGMKIKLSLIGSNRTTQVFVDGVILTIDNTNYNISELTESELNTIPFYGIDENGYLKILYRYNAFTTPKHLITTDENDYLYDVETGEISILNN